MMMAITVTRLVMIVMLGVIIISCEASVLPPVSRAKWTYDDPNKWPTKVVSCGGEHQSPVNIEPAFAIQDPDMPALTFVNYNKSFPYTITNNGYTVVLQLKKNEENDNFPAINKGGFSDTYVFQQLHFHWGDDSKGSEHQIDGFQFLAEMHIVHYNTKYGSFEQASSYSDGLAVLAIMIEKEKRDNVAFAHIEHFEKIVLSDSAMKVPNEPISLEDLLPEDVDTFYRYTGSLTAPGCNEAVIWTVFPTPIALSERQVNMFRQLFDVKGRPLVDNFRPVQSLNGRLVFFRNGTQQDSPSTSTVSSYCSDN